MAEKQVVHHPVSIVEKKQKNTGQKSGSRIIKNTVLVICYGFVLGQILLHNGPSVFYAGFDANLTI